jgi:hypothetical protein
MRQRILGCAMTVGATTAPAPAVATAAADLPMNERRVTAASPGFRRRRGRDS